MQDKEAAILAVIDAIENLVYQFNHIEDYEKRILQAVIKETGCTELHGIGVSLAECHVIDCIGSHERVNTTAIARQLRITKGGISKITAKLLKKKMIESHRLDNNQKEIYFRLTPLGCKLFQLHAILHKQARERFSHLLDRYTAAELSLARRLLSDLSAAFQATAGKAGTDRQV